MLAAALGKGTASTALRSRRRSTQRRGPTWRDGCMSSPANCSPPEERQRTSAGSDRASVGGVLRGVRLLEGLRAIESVDRQAFAENAHNRRHVVGVDVEELRAVDLRGKTDVGDGRRIAVGEAAGLAFSGQVRFHGFERLERPVRKPLVARGFVLTHLLLEIAADPRYD